MICPVCERAAIDGCTHPMCQTKFGLDGLISFFHYSGTVRPLIKALKYRGVFDVARVFGDLVPATWYASCRTMLKKDAVCVPIPQFRLRTMQRGYNQAELLGLCLAQKLRIPMDADILYRTKQTVPQVEMKDRRERVKNMKGVFSLRPGVRKLPGVVFLCDDVFTTGATMRAACLALKRGGVRNVWAVTFAR